MGFRTITTTRKFPPVSFLAASTAPGQMWLWKRMLNSLGSASLQLLLRCAVVTEGPLPAYWQDRVASNVSNTWHITFRSS